MKFDKKVPDNFGISEIPKKSFPRNPEKFPRHFPKFPDFPEILGFSRNSGIFGKTDMFDIVTNNYASAVVNPGRL
jgi:hypothetical protein